MFYVCVYIYIYIYIYFLFKAINIRKNGFPTVPGGERPGQAERGSERPGAGGPEGVRGAGDAPLCVGQWGESPGLHLPHRHQGESRPWPELRWSLTSLLIQFKRFTSFCNIYLDKMLINI